MSSTPPPPNHEHNTPGFEFEQNATPRQADFADELVRGYYVGLFQFGLVTLGLPDAARQTALRALAQACHDRNALSAGGRLWLYNAALRELRHLHAPHAASAGETPPAAAAAGFEASLRKLVDRWDTQERQTAALYYLLRWPAAEIAALLKVGAGAVQAQLDIFRSAFAALPDAADSTGTPATERVSTPGLPALSPIETRVASYLQTRWPAPPLDETEAAALSGELNALCAALSTPGVHLPAIFWIRAAGGLLLLALVVGLAALLWIRVRGRNLQTTSPSATQPAAFVQPTPFPSTPVAPLLNRKSTSSNIIERWQNSATLWHSLSIDVQTIDYGPLAYVGPPRRYRSQGWVLQPENGIQLTGLLSQPAAQVNLVGGERIFTRSYVSGRTSSRAWSTRVNALIPDDPLRTMVFPVASPWFQREGSFWWAASTEMLGRRVEIFDWLNHLNEPEARLYLDAQTGLILRKQIYTGDGFETLRQESIVTELQFERHEPPPALIVAAQQSQGQDADPHAGFLPLQATPTPAVGATPRAPLPLDPPPPGMDPSRSRLIFQFADDPSVTERLVNTADVPAMLFADGYFLGETRFGLPWALRCTRSQDGSRLAFNTATDGASAPDDGLHWFSLTEPGSVYQPMPGFHSDAFAFSPDARSLAATGFYDPTGQGEDVREDGLYRVDLALGEGEHLLEVYEARSLVWSPDGLFVALIGRLPGEDLPAVLVVNVNARLVIYHGEPGVIGDQAPADSPIPAWNVNFPTSMGNLDTCAEPLP